MDKTLKRFRWENKTRVVEIVAESLQDAREKALTHLYYPITSAYALVTENDPDTIEEVVSNVAESDLVNTWLKDI